ncbi:hypothetical protein Tco_0843450 [Tanacetum coccineum]|uniref:Uncharacterized protein n=1 Tax=Tanacetum coccineum TaxID=301880 RepID=A0ABQ5B634_9ASTR
MELCTNLQQRVLALETTKTTQANEIDSLKRRVKKLEKKDRKRTHKLKRLYKVSLSVRVVSFEDEGLGKEDVSKQGRIADIDADEGITLDSTHFDADIDMFRVHELDGDEVIVESVDVVKTAKETVNATALLQTSIMVEEPVKKFSKKDQIRLDEELAFKLQAEEEEEERLAREKDEANVALTEESKRAEEQRNKPPTKAQQKKTMITYLKNMEGWMHKDLRSKDFDYIKELFGKAFKRVNIFIDYITELVEDSPKKAEAEIAQESSSKRAGDELEQENAKKQKVDDDQEAAKMKELMKIVPDEEEVAIDAIPLATKPPSIID